MTEHCAVIGSPIAHSKSPEIHAGFAKERGIDLNYARILAEEENFADTVEDFFKTGGRGLNITVPFKEHAYRLCDKLTPYAKTAGAVNTLWIDSGELWGDNTDGRGLVQALTQDCGRSLAGKKILLLGAGGAAKGVLLPLLESNPALLHIHNRTAAKAKTLADSQQNDTVQAVEDITDTYDIIINATSSGLSDAPVELPAKAIGDNTLCYEMMYGKTTPFMRWASENGAAEIADGYSMLIGQAHLSFNTWFPPD